MMRAVRAVLCLDLIVAYSADQMTSLLVALTCQHLCMLADAEPSFICQQLCRLWVE